MLSDMEIIEVITRARLESPGQVEETLATRERPKGWQTRRLLLVAADHPARRTVAAGGDPWAMANRPELLRRVVRLMMQPFVDGALVTADILEELASLNHWSIHHGGPNFLDGKVLIGSMNRGGLSDTAFEMDDFLSAFRPETLQERGLDAAKLLLRIDPTDANSGRTLRYVADALERLAKTRTPVFLEPIPAPLSADNLVRLMGVASGLGSTSQGRWLKVPMVSDFERITRSTTCPIVLLGGAEVGSTENLLLGVRRCMESGPNVRGVLLGRGLLYPRDGSDPRHNARRLAALLDHPSAGEVVEWADL